MATLHSVSLKFTIRKNYFISETAFTPSLSAKHPFKDDCVKEEYMLPCHSCCIITVLLLYIVLYVCCLNIDNLKLKLRLNTILCVCVYV